MCSALADLIKCMYSLELDLWPSYRTGRFSFWYRVVKHSLIPYLDKVGVFGIPDRDHSVDFLDQLLFLIVIELHVPFGQSRLACSVLNEDEADLENTGKGSRHNI